MTHYISDFVRLCLDQSGDHYVYGAEAAPSDPNPDTFDCSELVQWADNRLGGNAPDGSKNQWQWCDHAGLGIPVDQAIHTQGALLFHFDPKDSHVAVSLGNGNTIEARGKAYGVGSWSAVKGRAWTNAGLMPGWTYGAPPVAPLPGGKTHAAPAWPGRYLTQPPIMSGDDVRTWQTQLRAIGVDLKADGDYGPASEQACRDLQAKRQLKVDGIVGPATWAAAWTT